MEGTRKYNSYTGEFKLYVIKTMLEKKLSYRETGRIFGIPNANRIISWKRIYDAEGTEGLLRERRGGDHRSHKNKV